MLVGCSPLTYSYIDPIYAPPRYYLSPQGFYDPFYYRPGFIYPRRVIVLPSPRNYTPRQVPLPRKDYNQTPSYPKQAPIRQFKKEDK